MAQSSSIRQITIIGTGLIGGSLGLALRKNGLRGRIIGCDRPKILTRAKRAGAIHAGVTDPVEACKGSDVVVLATPVGAIIELIERLAPTLSSETLVTDVGSTKAQVVARAQKSFGSETAQQFLAGHPMAGKENSGIEFADANLFYGAVWFLTPVPGQKIKAGRLAEYVAWIKKIGARSEILDADAHDQL